MSAEPRNVDQRGRKARWLILSVALTFALLACAGAVVIVILYRSNVPLVMGAATVAGVSLEVLMWTAAGVFGWGFLAKRREAIGRWKRRLFGRGKSETSQP
ncbi:MAG TPA: hypothetical protein VEA80_16170 [Vitreimonas sp.]|uniref:hypothetical protein n=1 Tax=Vitreimonas sp. TaxID=3069702 RepID=UPI002D59397B|nr:hypothetical protein [Vitreimonas sp.]HYD89013.1 hypothetical protein [Vitreimonas sp.]